MLTFVRQQRAQLPVFVHRDTHTHRKNESQTNDDEKKKMEIIECIRIWNERQFNPIRANQKYFTVN